MIADGNAMGITSQVTDLGDAFVMPCDHDMDPADQEKMAKTFHAKYVAGSAKRLPPNMRPSDKLEATLVCSGSVFLIVLLWEKNDFSEITWSKLALLVVAGYVVGLALTPLGILWIPIHVGLGARQREFVASHPYFL